MLPAQGPCREEYTLELERLMQTYGSSVKRLCCLYLRDLSLAEDAAQETFIKAWHALPGFRKEASERTWLMHIAINVCRDQLRTSWFRRLDRRITPDELPLTSAEPEMPALAEALLKLPARDREVLLLRYYEQMQATEISQMLHIPLTTTKSRINRAKKKLRILLEGWDDDE